VDLEVVVAVVAPADPELLVKEILVDHPLVTRNGEQEVVEEKVVLVVQDHILSVVLEDLVMI